MIAQAAIGKQLTVTWHLDPAAAYIHADVRRLRQILVNLLYNVVKFTPKGGQIGLDVQDDSVEQIVVFTVWDTGIGIASDDLARLFQPFVQIDSRLNRQYEGTGLGAGAGQTTGRGPWRERGCCKHAGPGQSLPRPLALGLRRAARGSRAGTTQRGYSGSQPGLRTRA
jgi:hypothetical protein